MGITTLADDAARVDLSTLGDDTAAGGGAQKEESRRLLDAAAEIFAFSGAGGPRPHPRDCNFITEHSEGCHPLSVFWRARISV